MTGALAREASGLALRAEAIRVRLGGAEILRGVDLKLLPGRVVGVLGPSGAGKSTLFRALVGELRPIGGDVWLGSERVTRLPLWRRARAGLGYVPQTPSVLLELSVGDNVRVFRRATGAGEALVRKLMDRLALADRVAVRALELSGGERRRLELVRALLGRPAVLVCDEPLSGVDPLGARRIGEVLRDEAARGAAVLLADHRITEALPFCDEAALLIDGRIDVVAAPEAFAEHQAVRRRYLG